MARMSPGMLPVTAVKINGVTSGCNRKPSGSSKGFGTGLFATMPNSAIKSLMGSSVEDPFNTLISDWTRSVEGGLDEPEPPPSNIPLIAWKILSMLRPPELPSPPPPLLLLLSPPPMPSRPSSELMRSSGAVVVVVVGAVVVVPKINPPIALIRSKSVVVVVGAAVVVVVGALVVVVVSPPPKMIPAFKSLLFSIRKDYKQSCVSLESDIHYESVCPYCTKLF